jgi:Transposase DDE domain
VQLYKELSDVERTFADLKDVLDMRPIYHRTDNRVQANIYVAALAFLLHRAIEKKLTAARLDLSATEALTALKCVRVVDIDLGDGTPSGPAQIAPPRCYALSASPNATHPPRHNRRKP